MWSPCRVHLSSIKEYYYNEVFHAHSEMASNLEDTSKLLAHHQAEP